MVKKMDNWKNYIVDTPDFPDEGITFRDVSPLLRDKMSETIAGISSLFTEEELAEIDCIAGIESRGFIFGAALAVALNKGFVMIRKQGKLPNPAASESYSLEYGEATLEMHSGSGNIMIVDDVIATSGTMNAAANLCKQVGYNVRHIAVLVDLNIIPAFSWEGIECRSLIRY